MTNKIDQILLIALLISLAGTVTAGQTPIFNSDRPGGSGDWENNERYLDVECKLGNTVYKAGQPSPALPTGYTCKKARGGWCQNSKTQGGCRNMQVRWLWRGGATPWFDRDRPSGDGDFETIEHQLKTECYFGTPPANINSNSSNKFTPQSNNLPAGYTCDKLRGAWCQNKKTQPRRSCRSRPVTIRYFW